MVRRTMLSAAEAHTMHFYPVGSECCYAYSDWTTTTGSTPVIQLRCAPSTSCTCNMCRVPPVVCSTQPFWPYELCWSLVTSRTRPPDISHHSQYTVFRMPRTPINCTKPDPPVGLKFGELCEYRIIRLARQSFGSNHSLQIRIYAPNSRHICAVLC